MKAHILRIAAAAAALIAFAATNANAQPQDPQSQSVGLVLSGGGSKGIAHIGVIQALEENDIPIDYVTGTSMGAIVGGLYAAGYSPQEMMQLLLSKEFSYWSTGRIDPDLVYYFAREAPSPAMASIPIPLRGDSALQARQAVPASIINPMPMSFAFTELFAGYTAQCGGDFDRLFVPFRCVASDAAAKHKVVMGSGDLGLAVRSSMSFPIVFQPTQVDSLLLYDGGIYDNFPVDVMREDFNPDIIIGINVSVPETGPQTSLLDQLSTLVIQERDNNLDPAYGIKISIDLNEFGLLDFPQAQKIYDIGYRRGLEMVDSIKSRVTARRPHSAVEEHRRQFKAQTPLLRFDSIDVYGATPRQCAYLKHLFTGGRADTLSIESVRSGYYRAISSGRLNDLAPVASYSDSTGLFSMRLKASVKNRLQAGVGGYLTSSTTSYIYLSGSYSTLSFSSLSASAGAWLGQSYMGATLKGRLYLPTAMPTAIELQAVAFREKYYESDYLFFEDKAPSYILDHEYFGRLKWVGAAGSLCTVEAGVGFGLLKDSFYQPDTQLGYLSDRDHCRFSLWQAYAKFETNTLDSPNFPTSGRLLRATGMAVTGRYRHDGGGASARTDSPRWLQFEAVLRDYYSLGRHFSLGVEADVLLSTRKLVPDYNAAIVTAPAFLPTPSSYNSFNSAFHANQFAAVGLAPIYKHNESLSARIQGYCFMPLRRIMSTPQGEAYYQGHWLSKPVWFAEADICYRLPFATATAYCNYASAPTGNWNVGISFGIFMPAPRFLR